MRVGGPRGSAGNRANPRYAAGLGASLQSLCIDTQFKLGGFPRRLSPRRTFLLTGAGASQRVSAALWTAQEKRPKTRRYWA